MSLYDKAGGASTVAAIVDALFERISVDPEFDAWFAGADLARLKDHQRAFITVALGGPELYNGRSIRQAHSGMAITAPVFAAFVNHMVAAAVSVGVDVAVVRDVEKRIALMRAAVVEVR